MQSLLRQAVSLAQALDGVSLLGNVAERMTSRMAALKSMPPPFLVSYAVSAYDLTYSFGKGQKAALGGVYAEAGIRLIQ